MFPTRNLSIRFSKIPVFGTERNRVQVGSLEHSHELSASMQDEEYLD
jgi:hypothetical protein